MALMTAYLVAAKDLGSFFDAVRNAQAPKRFTNAFLKQLGFTSTNHRLFIPVLKGLGLLDQNGTPTQRYFDFLDGTQSKRVLASAIRDAYEDLFRIKTNAHAISRSELEGKLKSLTQGKLTDSVFKNTVKTFVELVKQADFGSVGPTTAETPEDAAQEVESSPPNNAQDTAFADRKAARPQADPRRTFDALTYRIEVILPSTRDKLVYDAIFRSLKEHLL